MGRFRLATVLRARHAQEDLAKAEVVRARSAARAARRRADRSTRALHGTDVPTGVTAGAVVAALAARRALAAGLAAAEHGVEVADVHTDARLADLAEAAKRRRIVEKLGERYHAEQRSRAAAADQRVIDEIAITANTRREVL